MTVDLNDIREKIEYASKYTGTVMVETKGYLKKDVTHRKVRWRKGEPWVSLKGVGFKIVGYVNLTEVLGLVGKKAVYEFKLL
jgi:hypothetical protein